MQLSASTSLPWPTKECAQWEAMLQPCLRLGTFGLKKQTTEFWSFVRR